MQELMKHLWKLNEGYTIELYTNSLHDAVLVSISPSDIEQHININMTSTTISELLQLEYYGINVVFPVWFQEPQVCIDPYANTNSFDEQYIN